MSNLRAFCAEHAPRPRQEFAELPIESFVGKFVKLGFPVSEERRDASNSPTIEHMWVKVEGINADGDEELRGTLNNHPQFVDYELGDTILFDRKEVEEIFQEEQA